MIRINLLQLLYAVSIGMSMCNFFHFPLIMIIYKASKKPDILPIMSIHRFPGQDNENRCIALQRNDKSFLNLNGSEQNFIIKIKVYILFYDF